MVMSTRDLCWQTRAYVRVNERHADQHDEKQGTVHEVQCVPYYKSGGKRHLYVGQQCMAHRLRIRRLEGARMILL